ncbi:CcmD family protein [Oligoflexia bacterium]|nr:CcmD family protein [Oligoflexia bacterium]
MESVPNTFPSLFWAYTIVWCLIALYVFSLARRVSKLEKTTSSCNIEGGADENA